MNVFGIAGYSSNGANSKGKGKFFGGRLAACAAVLVGTLAMPIIGALPASAAEHSLAGIRIFASVHEVLNRYGDPSSILTGAAAQGGSGSTAGPTGFPGAQGAFGGSGGPIGAVPPLQFQGGAGGPMFGPNGPMFGANGAPGGATGSGNAAGSAAPPGEVLYVYNRPGGLTLEFLLSPDGRVIQITVLGYKAAINTERGVALGTNYGKIIARYGYPEGQDNNGVSLTMTYLAHSHVSFVLKNEKVVGITVAAIE